MCAASILGGAEGAGPGAQAARARGPSEYRQAADERCDDRTDWDLKTGPERITLCTVPEPSVADWGFGTQHIPIARRVAHPRCSQP